MNEIGWNYSEFHQEKAEEGLSPEAIQEAWQEERLSQTAELEQQELDVDFFVDFED